MRLVSVDFGAYRRLFQTRVNLDSRVVAVLGPNEAGKTSFLKAMDLHLNGPSSIDRRELTRGAALGEDASLLSALFALDDDDRAALAHLDGGNAARWYEITKRLDGKLYVDIQPRPLRNRQPRELAVAALRRVARTRWARESILSQVSEEDEDDGIATSVADDLEGMIADLSTTADTLSDDTVHRMRESAEVLSSEGSPPTARAAANRLAVAIEKESAPSPEDGAKTILRGRRPRFALFDENARALASEYELSELDMDKVPGALDNLANLAGLNLSAALAAVTDSEYGVREGLLRHANERLEAVFRESWKQNQALVRLGMDESVLRVYVPNEVGSYEAIAERSDGFRAFVALTAFTARLNESTPPILLVDEAETHLHYDAQADLVRVFTKQTRASQVIYTTHSAGCLPEDLASGVRILELLEGSDLSRFRNSFWLDGTGGFDPLLIGMGASAFAFAATRFAVIAEGGADAILLPTLLREAASVHSLGFQVAPGLAEVSADAVRQLDLVAARVSFLVDGDAAGRSIRKKLIANGVPEERIIVLGEGTAQGLIVEDLLLADVYRKAVNEELQKSHGQSIAIPRSTIPDRARSAAVRRWCASRRIDEPNRAAVAARVVEMREQRLLSRQGSRTARKLHAQIRRVLKIE